MTVTAKQGPIEITASKEMKLAASKGGPPSAITIETDRADQDDRQAWASRSPPAAR